MEYKKGGLKLYLFRKPRTLFKVILLFNWESYCLNFSLPKGNLGIAFRKFSVGIFSNPVGILNSFRSATLPLSVSSKLLLKSKLLQYWNISRNFLSNYILIHRNSSAPESFYNLISLAQNITLKIDLSISVGSKL